MMLVTLVGQIVNLRRIVNPPGRCEASPPGLAAVPASCGRRIANPPQVTNLVTNVVTNLPHMVLR